MKEETFYLVREDVLPDAMRKTLEVKKLLDRKKAESVADAVQKVDLSRSAFYKYRDAVFPFYTMVKEQIITHFFHVEDRSGALSQLLQAVADSGSNVLSIHQTIPLQGRANVTLSISTSAMEENIHTLMNKLRKFDFIEKVEILGSGA
ncbi:transcriptional regulator ThrR [Bacillus velezensis]